MIIRQCTLDQYTTRSKQFTNLGLVFVASFFEESDSECPHPHIHSLVHIPCSMKTYQDHFRKAHEERNTYVLKQIKPVELDPTHLENTLLYISKDGQQLYDDLSIEWSRYALKRVAKQKVISKKPTFNEFLVEEFTKEYTLQPHLYKYHYSSLNEDPPRLLERNVLAWVRKYFTGKYKDFDEMILIRKYHFLNAYFHLGGLDVLDLAIEKLFK